MPPVRLAWQSKLVLLLVLPAAAVDVVLEAQKWAVQDANVAAWTLGLSTILGLCAWLLRSGTPAAAFTGAILTASLMFSTAESPFAPWRTALSPVLTFLVITSLATRFRREGKERLGTAEQRHGRGAAQVAANLGMAALVLLPVARIAFSDKLHLHTVSGLYFAVGLAALAEAAADTISSELGQVLGGTPRMLTTFRPVAPGTDGGVTLAGTASGVVAAALIAGIGTWALNGSPAMFWISWGGGVFGLFFDSLLGATLERRGLMNNDWVNFASTGSAAAVAMGLLAAGLGQ